MLMLKQFEKMEVEGGRLGETRIKLVPRKPVAGLGNLVVFVFTTGFMVLGRDLWAWEWQADGLSRATSMPMEYVGRPQGNCFGPESAAKAALDDASYWMDEVRIPRERREQAERDAKEARLRQEVRRFLDS